MKEYTRKPSKTLTFEDAIEIWVRYRNGEFQHRIAAQLDVNPGRVSEVLKGTRFPGSEEASNRFKAA